MKLSNRQESFIVFCTIIFSLAVVVFVALNAPPRTIKSIFPLNESYIKEAKYYRSACTGVQCTLCPYNCFLSEGQRGICRVRMNVGNRLVTLVYGQPVAAHIDPIEKKPVYHILPGTKVFSIATVGCNLRCTFCQNWDISQSFPEQAKGSLMSPEEVVELAISTGCQSVAYTYSEPTVFFEYVLDTAKLAKQKGLKNVLVSAGYINPEPLRELAPYFDVIKIDLKGFNEKFYREVVGGHLRFVLDTLLELKKLGVLTEVVNLVVPTFNDKPEELKAMCEWIYKNLGKDTPLFFSRFQPQYKLTNLPPTPVETLEKARNIARDVGSNYVYIGNVPGHLGENTYCPFCHNVLIRRYGYAVLENKLRDGRCQFCATKIPGIWE